MYGDQEIGVLFIDAEGNLCKNYDTIVAVVNGYFTTPDGNVGYELVKKPKHNSDEDY